MRGIRIALILLALAGCDERAAAPEEPQSSWPETMNDLENNPAGQYDATREWMLEDMSLLGTGREQAREAARAYVLARDPGARIKGMATLSITGNLFLVGVDTGKPQGEDLLVRRFFDDSGQSYWKAQPLTETLARAITGHESRALQRDLEISREPE